MEKTMVKFVEKSTTINLIMRMNKKDLLNLIKDVKSNIGSIKFLIDSEKEAKTPNQKFTEKLQYELKFEKDYLLSLQTILNLRFN